MEHTTEWKRLGKGDLPTEDMDTGLGHIVPIDVYNKVFAALVVLTLATVWAATLEVSGTAHIIVAMFIALIKAALVYGCFMHLLFEKKIIWIIVTYPLFILALMILGTTGDASVKRESIPSNVEIEYKKGKGFGVNDEFLQAPDVKEDTAHSTH